MVRLASVRKLVAALAGVAAVAVSQGLISGTAAKWLDLGVSLATALAVYLVPNDAGPAVLPPQKSP